MIDRDNFIANIVGLFDETDASEITLDTTFRNLEEWSSLIGMGVMAMATDEYGVTITATELGKATTFSDLAQLIDDKK